MIDEIKELIRVVHETGVAELEVQWETTSCSHPQQRRRSK